ncbi:MAG: energy transducer TonB [Sphingobium sp.]|nr:energy transducer TonB [Sphingobium sp.]
MSLPVILIWAAAASVPQDVVPRANNMGWFYLHYSGDTKATDGSTFFKLIVGRDGKPEQCVVLLSTHNAALNKAVCIHAMKFSYKPALDGQGQPTYGVAETMVNFQADRGGTIYLQQPDFIVDLAAVPEGLPPQSYVKVAVEVDEQGMLKACNPGAPVKDQGKLNAVVTQMQKIACKQLPLLWDSLVETNLEKKRISYVRTIRVGFEKQKDGVAAEK